MKILIIEDEPLTAKDLKRTILATAPQAEILDILDSVEDSINYLSSNKEIDLIFSDIQLTDGLSFEIFNKINNTIPIIFCTAFDQYALDAFKETGIEYILKPFDKEAIQHALQKYHSLKEKFETPQPNFDSIIQALQTSSTTSKATSIIVKKADKIIPLPFDQVALFFIEDNYVFAFTFNKEKHMVSKSLDDLEEMLIPTFFRVNRQQLVNRKAVKEASQYFHRKVLVHLNIPFQESIIVGKLKVTSFLEWLSNN